MVDIHRQRFLPLHPSLDLAGIKALLLEWVRRARSRRHIADLDDRTIRDLGLTPSQMEFEARKPFWRS